MRSRFDSERGATAILVAGALVFLFGAAALAVDTSIFYGDARNDQKTADLSCLAGVMRTPTPTASPWPPHSPDRTGRRCRARP
jgi:Flp pilus assembly protein TadG